MQEMNGSVLVSQRMNGSGLVYQRMNASTHLAKPVSLCGFIACMPSFLRMEWKENHCPLILEILEIWWMYAPRTDVFIEQLLQCQHSHMQYPKKSIYRRNIKKKKKKLIYRRNIKRVQHAHVLRY